MSNIRYLQKGFTYLVYTRFKLFESTNKSVKLDNYITQTINKNSKGNIVTFEVGFEKKRGKILKVNQYISTNTLTGERIEGLVWEIEPLDNPIPVATIIPVLTKLLPVLLGVVVVLALDKVEEIAKAGSGVIKETGGVIREIGESAKKSTLPIIIIAGAFIGSLLIKKGVIK